jgi:hypothetical protein
MNPLLLHTSQSALITWRSSGVRIGPSHGLTQELSRLVACRRDFVTTAASILVGVAETNSQAAIRLRSEADAAEQQARHLMNISVLLVGSRHYDVAIEKARALLDKAKNLRELARKAAGEFDVP